MQIKHVWRNIEFASFINRVMWNRANARVSAGTMGLCFSWQGANGQTFAAFQTGQHVTVYRAMDAVWPPAPFGLCPTRRERQERLEIGEYGAAMIRAMQSDDCERWIDSAIAYRAGYDYACGYHD
jgi:hypothetical protein